MGARSDGLHLAEYRFARLLSPEFRLRNHAEAGQQKPYRRAVYFLVGGYRVFCCGIDAG